MSPGPARHMASVVQPGRRTEVGDELPLLWHWAYFPDLAPAADLAADGHPRRADAWAQRFPRRVAGGGRARRLAPFVLGTPARRRSELLSAKQKTGRSGDMVICDWLHTYEQGGQTVLEEDQTVIYREPRPTAGPGAPPAEARRATPPEGDGRSSKLVRRLEFGPVLLFRFSAVTWNSHRIHYDRPYATLEEGYEGLLVHGPLLAMLLAQEPERVLGGLTAVEFRVTAPVFDTETVDVFVRQVDANTCEAEARKADGTVAASLRGTLGGKPEATTGRYEQRKG